MTEPITDDVLLDFADALGDAPADTVLFRTANSNHDLFDMTAGMFTALLAELRQRRAAPAPQAVALTDEQRDELARVLSSRDSRWTHFDWDAQRDETRGYYRRIIDALAAAWPTQAPAPACKQCGGAGAIYDEEPYGETTALVFKGFCECEDGMEAESFFEMGAESERANRVIEEMAQPATPPKPKGWSVDGGYLIITPHNDAEIRRQVRMGGVEQ